MYKSSYHNTTGVQGKELDNLESAANERDQFILKLFIRNPGRGYTAAEIVEHVIDSTPQLSRIGRRKAMFQAMSIDKSTRRSISNLAYKHGYIEKTDVKRGGHSGRNNHVYVLTHQGERLL